MLAYLDDLESDFSAIHRVDDMYAMPGPRFFRLTHRMPCYQSVMRERVVALAREQAGTAPQPAPGYRSASAYRGERKVVPGTRAAIQADPVMSGVFSFG